MALDKEHLQKMPEKKTPLLGTFPGKNSHTQIETRIKLKVL